jgi:surface polysaccharide O-acyltransferase-like enzyme
MYTDKDKAKNRIFYYDGIKTLAIYLVCIYHYNNLDYNIIDSRDIGVYLNYYFYGIPSMAVPLFFMVNGALLLNKSYKLESHLRKIVYLYILFFVWSAISLIVFIPIEGTSYSLKEFLTSWFYLKQGTSNHLWFLQALIAVYLLFPFLKIIYDLPQRKLLKLFSFIIFVFSFGNLFLNSVFNVVEFIFGFNYFKGDPFNLFPVINPFGNYYYAFFYFILGGIISDKVANRKNNVSIRVLLIIFSTALFLLFLYGVLMTKSNNVFYDTVWNGYDSIMTLTMSTSVFLFFSKLSYKNRIINRFLVMIGSSTLGIYFVHRFVGSVTISYFHNLILSENLVLNLLYGCLLILSSLLIVLILKRLPLLRKIVDV